MVWFSTTLPLILRSSWFIAISSLGYLFTKNIEDMPTTLDLFWTDMESNMLFLSLRIVVIGPD